MNIKAYIDYFDEISSLDRNIQFDLLEQARNEITQHYSLPIFKLTSNLLPLFFVMLICGGVYLLFGVSILALIIAGIIGLVISRVVITEINSYYMRKGLEKVLENNPP